MHIEGQRGTPHAGDMSDPDVEAAPETKLNRAGRDENRDAWREYEYLGDLYKFYLDLVVKAAGGYFVVVGGILTLVLANVKRQPIVVVALLVPMLMSILLTLAAWKAKPKVRELRVGIDKVAQSLEVAVKPHVEILEWGVSGSSLLLLIFALLLAGLFGWLVATT